ncbi:MAG TPA: amine oxidase, partial [Pseudobdellovibrionaceae bacterium]|nr:amine oxidase [Pseudobdellovibrionaceae bacterium]
GVEVVASDMSLSIQILGQGLEWGGKDLASVFAQKRNLLYPPFYRMLLDIMRFNKNAQSLLSLCENSTQITLRDLLEEQKFSAEMRDWYIVPMAAAIWSTPAEKILDFPAATFLRFCINHHLLQVEGRPQWKTVKGGARVYVEKMLAEISEKSLDCAVLSATRQPTGVLLTTEKGDFKFDKVLFATHADQTLKILKDASEMENKILSQFHFQKNQAIVHLDSSFLPQRKKIWSAWNYVSSPDQKNVSVSYLINQLQPLPTTLPVLVTLNPHKPVAQDLLLKTISYHHPVFTPDSIAAQSQMDQIQGRNNTFFAGAWMGYGFHEDGLKAALRVAQVLKLNIPWSVVYE